MKERTPIPTDRSGATADAVRPSRDARGRRRAIRCALALWAASSAGGLAYLVEYAARPGAQRPAPATWPDASAIPREAGVATLVIFLHPHCPCSSATVSELERALAHASAPARVFAALCRPAGTRDEWSRTPLRQRVERLAPGGVIDDAQGREAGLFGAATSGETALYDARGRLVFRGGLTPARGHEGDNPGRGALAAWLRGDEPSVRATPVFGCPLDALSASADAACCEAAP